MLSLLQAINFYWSNCSACVLDIMTEFNLALIVDCKVASVRRRFWLAVTVLDQL
jgi:hypothetical protein